MCIRDRYQRRVHGTHKYWYIEMPVKQTKAKLWFDTEEEERNYDDLMISNIELKSLDFDDENFSPVFNRSKEEVFLEPSEKARTDFSKFMRPTQSYSFPQFIDRYVLNKPNHTYYRHFNIDKFWAGLGLGYLLIRELPVRNFYARVFIMWIYLAKVLDHYPSIFPNFAPMGRIVAQADRWILEDIRCYDNAFRAATYFEIPTVMNKVREGRQWYGKQPGHLQRADLFWMGHYLSMPFKANTAAYWDGTNSMPIMRLADPKHKDSYMMHYM
eukprot:TRINITY_DN186_c0_g1_i10.p1 TRINITY_DN186_c0_g1~~TRINITY_DN186_c0_g1_i10.p1  ORF type:complete len:270 (-),score=53.73 TRINITY_DN186_c0_g1_i10:50-859(-)